jgi:hypothetical protein
MTELSRLFLYLLLPVGALIPGNAQVSKSPQATVEFLVTDPFGNPLSYRCREFVDARTRKDLAGHFDGLRSEGIPYGRYHYILTRTDVQSRLTELTGEVSISEPTVWVSCSSRGLVVFSEGHEGVIDARPRESFVINGTVQPMSSGPEPVWVRLQPLYQEFRLETKVDSDGRFRFSKAVNGAFLVLVFRGRQLFALKSVTLISDKEQKIQIDMSKDRYPR